MIVDSIFVPALLQERTLVYWYGVKVENCMANVLVEQCKVGLVSRYRWQHRVS